MTGKLPKFESKILIGHKRQTELLKLIDCFKVKKAKLLYRASADGFTAEAFHRKCDNKGPTLIVASSFENPHSVSSKKRIFGGFTDIAWSTPSDGNGVAVEGEGNSFVFTYDHRNVLHKYKCLNPAVEVYHYADRLAVFGDGHFLSLDDNKAGSTYTQSNAYSPPSFRDPNVFIAGNKNFKMDNIEVFNVKLKRTRRTLSSRKGKELMKMDREKEKVR